MAAEPVIISGAGPCGLMCALVLQREGVPFVLVERAEREKVFANVGSVVDIANTSMRIFSKLDLPIEQFTRKPAKITMVGKDLSAVRSVPATSYTSQRSELQRGFQTELDKGAMDARFGIGVSGYSENDSGVKVDLTDGSSITGRALLACDGWKSAVRAQMLRDDPVHFCGVSMWWASCKMTPELKKLADMDMVMTMPEDKESGCFFSCPNSTGEYLIWCAGFPTAGETGASNDLTQRGGVRGSLVKDELAKLMAGHSDLIAAAIAATPGTSVTKVGLYDRQNLDQPFVSAGGRVALLGDAAHPQTPFFGQGCNMALADAFATCTRLAHQDVRAALRALDDSERKAYCKWIVTGARSNALALVGGSHPWCLCLQRAFYKCMPASFLSQGPNLFDEGNKKFVDRALKDCGLPL